MDVAANQLFQHLVRHSAEPLLGLTPAGVVQLSCPAAGRLLSRTAADLRGRSLVELSADPANKVLEYLKMCARSLSPLPGSLALIDAKRGVVKCRAKGALLAPPQEAPPLVVLRITPREGEQTPFALLNEKIANLTREIIVRKRAEQEALVAIRLRDEFLTVASHELKTPLHSLKLQLELVTRALSTLDSFTRKRVLPKLETMGRQTDRLVALSSVLLDLSMLRSGQLPVYLEPHDLSGLTRAALDRMSGALTQAGCEVSVALDDALFAQIDPSRFDQVLVNLLSNAAKYGAGSPVEVSARFEGDEVVIEVADHGIGIEPEDLPRIFGKFERAVSPENYGGMGLGLYISAQLVESMGGRLTAASAPGRGSTFTLRFKRTSPPVSS